jgi:opacity protein-like surface antigen
VSDRRSIVRLAVALVCALGATVGFCRKARADASDLPPEVGWNYGEIETPRSAAMGGALRAYSNSVSALFINPANMAVSRVYHIGALAQIWPEASRQSYGGAAVDSIVSSARLAGGFGGTWTLQDPDGIDRTATDLRFALAFPFSDQFFLGVGGRYLWAKQDGLGPLGDSFASGGTKGDNVVRGFAFDAGATIKPTDFFALSLVGNNLNNPGHGFQPTSVGGGLGVGTNDLTVEADVLSDFTTWERSTVRAMAGVELLIADHYPIRGGYRYDDGAKSHAVSAGAGYVDRAFSAEVAVRRIVAGDAATAIFFGFTYHLESSGLTPSPEDF